MKSRKNLQEMSRKSVIGHPGDQLSVPNPPVVSFPMGEIEHAGEWVGFLRLSAMVTKITTGGNEL